MFRNYRHLSKLITAFGAFGLLIGFSAANLDAEVALPLSAANYSGRYVCTAANDDEFFTTVIKYNPNGNGAYTAGTLVASLAAFTVFDTASPATQFCTYTLDTTKSNYTIDTHGIGFETLVWNASPSNATECPCAGNTCTGGVSFFTDQTAIALRNATNANDFVQRSEISSANLLDEDIPGHGFCLK